MKTPRGGAAVFLALCVFMALTGHADSWEGRWSVPSLSQPSIPMLFSLQPGGKAAEQIGEYRGGGTWKIAGNAVRIAWDSKWEAILQPMAEGGFELLTWKKGSDPQGPPDDRQAARKVE